MRRTLTDNIALNLAAIGACPPSSARKPFPLFPGRLRAPFKKTIQKIAKKSLCSSHICWIKIWKNRGTTLLRLWNSLSHHSHDMSCISEFMIPGEQAGPLAVRSTPSRWVHDTYTPCQSALRNTNSFGVWVLKSMIIGQCAKRNSYGGRWERTRLQVCGAIVFCLPPANEADLCNIYHNRGYIDPCIAFVFVLIPFLSLLLHYLVFNVNCTTCNL